jgi:hypothetical protein
MKLNKRGAAHALLLAIALLVAHFASAEPVDEHLTILSSPDAPGTLTKSRMAGCLRQLLRQWDLRETNLPDMVVYHVSKKSANTAHVNSDVSARRNRGTTGQSEYFEIWLVGDAKPEKYILALQNVLEAHFGFEVTEQKRKQVMARVFRMQEAVVEVQQGK